ncbi:MAG: murein biosynthesis integral membrane protein MurJ [Vicinamibacterales bacterium]
MAHDSSGSDQEPAAQLPSERIGRSAGLAGSATLTSRVLGLVREQVVAGVFGAGNDMDAFLVALRIPSLARDLFAEGAMSAAFIPTFTKLVARRGREAAWQLANSVITALLLVTGVLVLLGILFARPIAGLYAPEFAAVPGKLDLTATLGRIVLPFLPLVAIAAVCMGMLNSLRHYFIPALAPATFNVSTIVCLLVLTPLMPWLGVPTITVLAVATLVGGVTQIAIQWPTLRREGYRYRPLLNLRDPGLRQMLVLMGPGTLGIASTQINLFVTTQLATYQGVGAVSWLQYAFRLIYLPIGVFGVSIATAVLPVVSQHAANDDRQGMGRALSRGLSLMMVINLPASVGLAVLSDDIIQLLFERGRFLPGDTAATAMALRCYAVGLIGYSTARIASPVFYALGRSRTAVITSSATIALNLVASAILTRTMGFSGLALSTSLCALFHGGTLLTLLWRQLGTFDGHALGSTLVKTLASSLAMGLTVWGARSLLHEALPGDRLIFEAVRVAVAISAGVATILAAAQILGIREVNDLVAKARRRA